MLVCWRTGYLAGGLLEAGFERYSLAEAWVGYAVTWQAPGVPTLSGLRYVLEDDVTDLVRRCHQDTLYCGSHPFPYLLAST